LSHLCSVTDLGHPAGVSTSIVYAAAMNDHGQIVGSVSEWFPYRTWPFVWRPSTGMVELPHAALPPHVDCRLTGINEYGTIIGVYTPPGTDDERPFRWEPHTKNGTTGTFQLLPLPDGTTSAHPTAINAAGFVVGWSDFEGYLWIPGLPPHRLPPHDIAPFDLNDYGQIVGERFHGDPYLWQPTSLGAPIGTHHSLGSKVTRGTTANAINRSGQVVGNTAEFNGPMWRWKPNAPNSTKGSFSTTGLVDKTCQAFAINDAGTAVGRTITLGAYRACAYWPNASDLNDWILPGTGWVLEIAEAINDSGWIAGNGTLAGEKRAFVLRPSVWKPLEFSFLRYVVQILVGVRPGGRGVVLPPGRGPEPVPPWVDRAWKAASKSEREALRAIARTDARRLLDDEKAHAKLLKLVPELAQKRAAPRKGRESGRRQKPR
jgi:hypothetical protein